MYFLNLLSVCVEYIRREKLEFFLFNVEYTQSHVVEENFFRRLL